MTSLRGDSNRSGPSLTSFSLATSAKDPNTTMGRTKPAEYHQHIDCKYCTKLSNNVFVKNMGADNTDAPYWKLLIFDKNSYFNDWNLMVYIKTVLKILAMKLKTESNFTKDWAQSQY